MTLRKSEIFGSLPYRIKPDISFISIPERANAVFPPHAAMILSGYLKKHTSFAPAIIDIKVPAHESITPQVMQRITGKILDQIAINRPRYVAFSAFSPDRKAVLDLAVRIKNSFKDIRVICGGILPTIEPESLVFEGSPVDLAVRGDGEIPLKKILGGEDIARVEGACFMDKGKMVDNGRFLSREKVDFIPAYDLIDMDYYARVSPATSIRPFYLKGFMVYSSFGCPFQCSFCANNKPYIRAKETDTLMEEIRLLIGRYNVNAFAFQDSCFLANKKKVNEFCDAMVKEKIDIPWSVQTRADLLTEKMLQKMVKAGLVQVSFGVESGSDSLLKRINKGITNDETIRAFALCRKYGVKTFANIMYNLPGETREDIAQTDRLLKIIKPTHVALSLTVPYIGTRIYEEHVRPALTHDEYGIYGSGGITTRIMDSRFHLAAHDLDLDRLYLKKSLRHYLSTSFGLMSADKWYLKSLRRVAIPELAESIGLKVYGQLRQYSKAALRLAKGALIRAAQP